MRRKQPGQLLLLVALVATSACLAFSLPASGARAIYGSDAKQAVRALIGPGLIRAEIVTFNAEQVGDYRIDRGIVRKIRGRVLTLTEWDGTIVKIRLSPTTQIRINNWKGTARRVRKGMRATVMRKGNAAASWLYVTRRPLDKSGLRIRALISADFVRAEVVSQLDGELLDTRADTGIIESADEFSLTLQEDDGQTVEMLFDNETEVQVNRRVTDPIDLVAGMKATTIGDGDGLVSQIWAYGKRSGAGKKK